VSKSPRIAEEHFSDMEMHPEGRRRKGDDMTALILLHTNPGSQEKGRTLLKGINVKDVKVTRIMHVFGRFDGVVFCEFANLSALNAFGEALRKDGVFDTETLIGIE